MGAGWLFMNRLVVREKVGCSWRQLVVHEQVGSL